MLPVVAAGVIVASLLAIPATALAGAVQAGDPAGGAALPDLHTVSGSIRAVDWADQKLTLGTADGPVELSFDRNTWIFLASHTGTVRQLHVGATARASFGPERRAFWIEVGPPAAPGGR